MRHGTVSFWGSKKRNDKQHHNQADPKNDPRNVRHRRAKKIKENNINGSEYQGAKRDGFVAFLMNIHQLNLFTNIKIDRQTRLFIFLTDK